MPGAEIGIVDNYDDTIAPPNTFHELTDRALVSKVPLIADELYSTLLQHLFDLVDDFIAFISPFIGNKYRVFIR
jgi:hypothetical protein